MIFVATGPVEPIAHEILRPFGEIVVAPDLARASLLKLLANADGLIVRGEGIVDEEVFAHAPRLRVIGRTGTGYNNVDMRTANKRGIPVIYTPGAGSRAVAEGAVAFILALVKRVTYWDAQTKAGNWGCRNGDRPGDLAGETIGIIGFGKIGQTLAGLLAPFGMKVLASDPYAQPSRAEELGARIVPLEDLLRVSRIISIHAPMTPETKGLINRERLAMMPRGSYIVNMARGGLIESLDVLYDALLSGQLAGVGLDVFDPEPPDVSHPIFKHKNCLTAPHVIGVTNGAMHLICKTMADGMAAVLRGERPQFIVNPQVLDGQTEKELSEARP